jgi:acyl-CoA synthetase (AMP-forming)/AMP-acid ligase II
MNPVLARGWPRAGTPDCNSSFSRSSLEDNVMNDAATRRPEVNATSIGEVARLRAASHPEAVAITFEGRRTTYSQLNDAASRVAGGLDALGIGDGDRVAVLDRNTDRFFEVWLGAAKLNAVVVPVNARLAGPEVEFILGDAEARVLFIGEAFVEMIAAMRPRLGGVKKIIVMNNDYEMWRSAQPTFAGERPSGPDEVCIQIYTSGTTGHPKGVQLMNRNFLRAMPDTLAAWGNWNDKDVALVAMPLFHIAGCGVGMLSFIGGLRIVVVRDFQPAQVIELIQAEKITVAFLVPAMIMFLLDDRSIESADLSAVRSIVYGASPIPAALLKRALARFAAARFVQIYGLTETTGGITVLSPDDHLDHDSPRMKSCGRPIPCVELKIMGPDGHPVPQGEVGEIVCRSVKNMKAYWRRDEETARTMRDGWIYTGDAGYLDSEGYLYIHDRVKDMIVSGGENIYPAEVESAMFGHPSIADIAVIGVPDQRWGEAVKALVVLRPGAAPDAAAIMAYTRARLAGYKVPKSIEFLDALPRNPTGKILKRELREKYWKGYERRVN